MGGNNFSKKMLSREEQIERYRIARQDSRDPDTRWVLLIKELRAIHGCSLLEAERIALADERLRRWVQMSINTRRRCRKQALAHIQSNGVSSLIEREGETFKFKIPRP